LVGLQREASLGPGEASKSKAEPYFTTSKKRKFNQISHATSQMESLNLEPRQLVCKEEHQSKRRRVNDVSNLSENVNQYVTLLKSESKPAPFSTLFNKNSSNVTFLSRQNSVELLSVKANCDSKQS